MVIRMPPLAAPSHAATCPHCSLYVPQANNPYTIPRMSCAAEPHRRIASVQGVPAIAVWPRVLEAGAAVREPLHMVDMYPTLLKLAGASLEQPLALDGKDAWPTIARGKQSPHEEILLNVTPYNGAIRRGNWKLVHNGKLGANYTDPRPSADTFELFNLADDPYEKNDLSEKNPQKLQELKRRLESYAGQAAKANIPPNRMPKDFKVPKAWGHPGHL